MTADGTRPQTAPVSEVVRLLEAALEIGGFVNIRALPGWIFIVNIMGPDQAWTMVAFPTRRRSRIHSPT